MTKQTKHTRKGFKAGRGIDLGNYKINDVVSYNHKTYKIIRKRFDKNFNLIICIVEDKRNKEIIELPEQFLKLIERR